MFRIIFVWEREKSDSCRRTARGQCDRQKVTVYSVWQTSSCPVKLCPIWGPVYIVLQKKWFAMNIIGSFPSIQNDIFDNCSINVVEWLTCTTIINKRELILFSFNSGPVIESLCYAMSSHAAEKSKFVQICSLIMEQSHVTLFNKTMSCVTGHDCELDVINYNVTEEDMTSPPQRTRKQQTETFSVLINIQLSI